MAHLAWRTGRSSGEGTNDPSSTQLAASLRLNVAESIGVSSSDRTSIDIELGTTYNGPDVFKVRELSNAETYHLNRQQTDSYLLKLKCFGDQFDRLKAWPKFFGSTEKSSLELRDGFVTLWTTFIVAESLLAGVSIQPFITSIPGLKGWQFEVYGLVWMLALMFDCMGFTVTALFLGYLHSAPAKLSYFWLCNLGAWVGIPSVLVLLGALSSLVAIAYSAWVIYGYRVGIVCVCVAGIIIILAILTSISLGKASADAQSLN